MKWYEDALDTEDFTEADCWVWVEEMLKDFWVNDPPKQEEE